MKKPLNSFFAKTSIKNLKVGTKINSLIFALFTFALLLIALIGLYYLKNFLENSNFDKLEEIAETKQADLKYKYGQFIEDFSKISTEDFASMAVELKNSFTDYENDNNSAFYDRTLAVKRTQLEDYYNTQILPEIGWNKPPLEEIFPSNPKTLVLQQLWIQNTNNEYLEKGIVEMVDDYTQYEASHMTIRPIISSFIEKTGVNNLYLIDNHTGDIFYNYNKNISFGTNLFKGAYKNTPLSTVFQRAAGSELDRIYIEDFSFFIPNLNRPTAFIAQAIKLNGAKVAVIVAELTSDFFEEILIEDWIVTKENPVEINLVGKDNLLRTNALAHIQNPEDFEAKLLKNGRKNTDYLKAEGIHSSSFVLGYNIKFEEKSVQTLETRDYLNNKVFAYTTPVNLRGLNWFLVAKVGVRESKQYLNRVIIIFSGLFLFFYILIFISTRTIISSIVSRLSNLSSSMSKLSKGEKTASIIQSSEDEVGQAIMSYESLKGRINSASTFAVKLGEGDYSEQFKVLSDEDTFGNALNSLRNKLLTTKDEQELRNVEDKKRDWVNQGIAKFNDLLRQSNDNIHNLAYIIIENLIDYLDANQGGVFLIEGEGSAKKINLIASFAYNRRKYTKKTIDIGEGLLGSCYLENKSKHLKNIPEDYIEISSGLGKAKPRSLYIVPLRFDNDILGFIELASFNDFEDYQIDIIEKLSENIAATFSTVKLNTKTAELLEESKRRANEIAQQEEEMRQNMEEMQATQEELARLREDDEKRTAQLQFEIENQSVLLQEMLDSYNGQVYLKDENGTLVYVNKAFADSCGVEINEPKGKPDVEYLSVQQRVSEKQMDEQALEEGAHIGQITEVINGEDVNFKVQKKIIKLNKDGLTGILTIKERN